MLRVTQGSSWEMTRCLLGARDGPGPHQASVLSASIGLGDPSPLQNRGHPAFSGSLVCMSGRVPVDVFHAGGICPYSPPCFI